MKDGLARPERKGALVESTSYDEPKKGIAIGDRNTIAASSETAQRLARLPTRYPAVLRPVKIGGLFTCY